MSTSMGTIDSSNTIRNYSKIKNIKLDEDINEININDEKIEQKIVSNKYFKQIKSSNMLLTPSIAKKLLKINTYEGQRPYRQSHEDFLANEILNGTFRNADIAIAKIYNEKTANYEYSLANGQHTSGAVIKTNIPVNVKIVFYLAHSEEGLGKLYRTFDTKISARSVNDNIRTKKIELNLNCHEKTLQLLISALGCLSHKESHANMENRLSKINQYLNEISFCEQILFGNKKVNIKHITRAPIIYAMILTFQKNPEESKKFWTQIRDGENIDNTMATYTLREFLRNNSLASSTKINGQRGYTYFEMVSKCIHAWNAFRKNTTTKLRIFEKTTELPKLI